MFGTSLHTTNVSLFSGNGLCSLFTYLILFGAYIRKGCHGLFCYSAQISASNSGGDFPCSKISIAMSLFSSSLGMPTLAAVCTGWGTTEHTLPNHSSYYGPKPEMRRCCCSGVFWDLFPVCLRAATEDELKWCLEHILLGLGHGSDCRQVGHAWEWLGQDMLLWWYRDGLLVS